MLSLHYCLAVSLLHAVGPQTSPLLHAVGLLALPLLHAVCPLALFSAADGQTTIIYWPICRPAGGSLKEFLALGGPFIDYLHFSSLLRSVFGGCPQ